MIGPAQLDDRRLLTQVGDRGFEIALSVPLVVEYEDVAKRQTDVTGLTYEDVDDIIDYLCSVAHLQEIHFLWRPVLRDAGDDHVLELAVEAGCRVVVTHNIRDYAGSEHFGDLEERAARGDRGTFERAMAKVRDTEPNEGDV